MHFSGLTSLLIATGQPPWADSHALAMVASKSPAAENPACSPRRTGFTTSLVRIGGFTLGEFAVTLARFTSGSGGASVSICSCFVLIGPRASQQSWSARRKAQASGLSHRA